MNDILTTWYNAVQKVQALKEWEQKERVLRQQAFNEYFPKPVEGTIKTNLANSYQLIGNYKLNRDVDEPAFLAVKEQLRELQCNPDSLIKYTPRLVLSSYRQLTQEQQKIVDQALVIKPALPQLTLKKPAQ